MSKALCGLFHGTKGSVIYTLQTKFSLGPNESTADVWEHLTATQPDYGGTRIPRSFEIDVPVTPATPDGKMWTHGNATEHMFEAVVSIKDDPLLKGSNPDLYTQFLLYDYYKSLGKAVSGGINFKNIIHAGRWEFAFSKHGRELHIQS